MPDNATIRFFDDQFRRQLENGDLKLNPFEERALEHMHGRVLDFGCGLGNLALTAARRGCEVVALDASPVAVDHLAAVARAEGLALEAIEADLRTYEPPGTFDTVVCIGLLMFFDCDAALVQLRTLQAHVRPGGIAIVNVLVEGTTYLDMFDTSGFCLFHRDELRGDFAGWDILRFDRDEFNGPGGTRKSFATVIARKPA